MCVYYYYALTPQADAEFLSAEEILSRVTEAFPTCEVSPEAARREAARNVAALEKLGVPEWVVKPYREGRPVRCRIPDPDSSGYLDFDVWDDRGLVVHPHPCDQAESTAALAKRLAEALGYQLSLGRYD